MRLLKRIFYLILIIATAAASGLFSFFSGSGFAVICAAAVSLCSALLIICLALDKEKPILFAFLYCTAILSGYLVPVVIISRQQSTALTLAVSAAYIIAVCALAALTAKQAKVISKSNAPLVRSAGAGRGLHIISVFFTAFCALALSAAVNICAAPVLCAVLCIICAALMAANAFIYRHTPKKIFEHFSIVFIAAGCITLLMRAGSPGGLFNFILSGAFLFAGALLMMLYVIFYHAQNRRQH